MTTLRSRGTGSAARTAAWLWPSLLTYLIAACSWQPIARDVEPIQLIEGPVTIIRRVSPDSPYVVLEVGRGEAARDRLLNLDTREMCEFPAGASVLRLDPHLAPNLRGRDVPRFLLAVVQARADGAPQLFYSDEKCVLRGPFLDVNKGFTLRLQELRVDKRIVSLVQDDTKTLHVVDPWNGQAKQLADRVERWDVVEQSQSSNAPETFWIGQTDGPLTQRALDGTVLLSLGEHVTGFDQTLRDQLRVAYVDGADVYEAKGPDFTPVLVANDACFPRYRPNLDLWTPCAKEQLVRVDLGTGVVRRFDPGVSYFDPLGEQFLESVFRGDGSPNDDRYDRWLVTSDKPDAKRFKLTPQPDPNPNTRLEVISGQRLLGFLADGTLGIWSREGQFTAAYTSFETRQLFRNSRTGDWIWLLYYGYAEQSYGTLAVLEQKQVERVVDGFLARDGGEPYGALDFGFVDRSLDGGTLDSGTGRVVDPSITPLVIAHDSRHQSERIAIVLGIDDAVILTMQRPSGDAGADELYAHLLSGERSMRIDEGVTSRVVVTVPFPAVLYGIIEGPRSGLWLAAL